MYKILFFSSSEISLPLLTALRADSRFEIIGVVCQPDKPVGRDKILRKPAPKSFAERNGISVFQPEKVSELLVPVRQGSSVQPDFLLTFAYGQILPENLLASAKIAALNVHASLLPKYRGASPIQAAILNGDKETGITLMKMVKEMDAGPIFSDRSMEIAEGMTASLLHDELADLAAEFVPDELAKVEAGSFAEQDHAAASFCKKITREDGEIDFKKSAAMILREFRAYNEWPGLWTTYKGKRLKLIDIEVREEAGDEVSERVLIPGEIACSQHEILIGTSDGSIAVKQLQIEGKQSLHANQFIFGQAEFCSSSLPS